MAPETIVIDQVEFPSDRLINRRKETFDPDVSGSSHPRPYRLALWPFVTEFDVGMGVPSPTPDPLPAPFGPGPSPEPTFYTYLFAVWREDWMRGLEGTFSSLHPSIFKAYYLAMDSGIDAETVHTHAVSLSTLRVLDSSPVPAFRDGVVRTAKLERKVTASPLLRDPPEEPEFGEWTAWTDPPAVIRSPSTNVLAKPEPEMTLARGATGRAVAFYKGHPEPPGSTEIPAEKPRLEPDEAHKRGIVERGDLDSVRRATRPIDKPLEHLGQLRDLLRGRLAEGD